MKILVTAAWEPELTHFRGLAASRLASADVVVAPLGVGLVEAAIAMTQRIADNRPDLALFVGTCGSLKPDRPVGSVVAGSRATLVCPAGELPGPMPADVVLDVDLHHALVACGARSAHVVNTLGVTVAEDVASRLGALGDVEHLEAFAFARACAVSGVRAAVVLGVANPVGPAGREAWRANHQRASDAAAEIAAELLVRTTTTRPTPA